MTVFVVENEVDVVHVRWCQFIQNGSQEYKTKPRTAIDLLTHLASPDTKDAHKAPHVHLVACDKCIQAMAATEREQLP